MTPHRDLTLSWLGPDDPPDLERAGHLFDGPVRRDAARRFLDTPTHHLCLARLDGEPVGFVSGVELTHPDKGTELFLVELGVDESARGRGIGTALVRAMADRARALGCTGMWTLTEAPNTPAIRTYLAGGGTPEDEPLVLPVWSFD